MQGTWVSVIIEVRKIIQENAPSSRVEKGVYTLEQVTDIVEPSFPSKICQLT